MMTTAARKQDMKAEAARQDAVHEVLLNLTFGQVLRAVSAHIEARPDADANLLEKHSNHMAGLAWEMRRNA